MPEWVRKYLIYMIILMIGILTLAVMVLRIEMPDPFLREHSIGVVLAGSADEPGWNRQVFNAVKDHAERSDTQLYYVQKVGIETGSIAAINAFREQRVNTIVLSSPLQPNELYEELNKSFDTEFIGFNPLNRYAINYSGISPRIYQAMFMAGFTAAASSKNGKIGFITGSGDPFSKLNINAFTLGARQARKNMQVYVAFTGSWLDVKAARSVTGRLCDRYGVDVLAYALATDAVAREARLRKVRYIGFLDDSPEKGHTLMLGHISIDFDRLLNQALTKPKHLAVAKAPRFCGFESDCVSFDRYSNTLDPDLVNRLSLYERELKNGYDVFSGRIVDLEGKERCTYGEAIPDQILAGSIDWYVEGVKLVP